MKYGLTLICVGALSACSGDGLDFMRKSGGNVSEKNAPSEPSNLPDDSYLLNEWIDDRGCSYLRTSQRWVPVVQIDGSHICNGSANQNFDIGEGVTDVHGAFTKSSAAPEVTVDDMLSMLPTATTQPSEELPFVTIIGPGADKLLPVTVEEAVIAPVVESTIVEAISPPVVDIAPAPVVEEPNMNGWVQVAAYTDSASVASTVNRLKVMGYQVKTINSGGLEKVYVAPRPGQSIEILRRAMRSIGYTDVK